ncbi:hypothetical protein [Crenalkalicoccus roseus]|uniref:hypothetical protein n=1 Tax=Crenalkalicoccus roseus TaxID=1485588 RepID=UPI001F0316B9|nr:hypothetical protein [Crenalkalicoccus roseus]
MPPANQSPQGDATPGEGRLPPDRAKENVESRTRDPSQQGHQGATWQGTHHQGYQQDR